MSDVKETINPIKDDLQMALYQVLSSRRLGYDSLMWQTPVLGLTAQAFLFNVALGPNSSRFARVIASVLALVTSLISIQLMVKHHHFENADSKFLQDIERKLHLPQYHGKPEDRQSAHGKELRWFVRVRAHTVWIGGLALFGIAALVILYATVYRPEWLQ